nr:hypothetical protein [Bacteroidales bacterium]
MKKKIVAIALALLLVVPAFAVLNERDLAQTLSVLRFELGSSYRNSEKMAKRMRGYGDRQHSRLVRMMQQSNEMSLMLYSQKQDYTFDMTYALNEVSRQYDEFSSRRRPFNDIIKRLDIDIDRYTRLVHTLKSLPPSTTVEYLDSLGNVVTLDASVRIRKDSGLERRFGPHKNAFQLDSLGQADRDSCIFYAEKLLEISKMQKEHLIADSTHYQQTSNMLKSAYDYAQQRYKNVQNKIFIEGQSSYVSLLKGFKREWPRAVSDSRDKYSLKNKDNLNSQWRGPMVIGFSFFVLFYLVLSLVVSVLLVNLLSRRLKIFKRDRLVKNKFTTILISTVVIFALSIMLASTFSSQHFFSMASKILIEFAWMLAAIFVSLIIRVDQDSVRKGILMYLPTLLMCLIIISFRIVFIPNSLLNFIFPPILLVFTVLQGLSISKYRKVLPQSDVVFGWVSFVVMIITT